MDILKSKFNEGDSVYGFVKFQSVFFNEYGNPAKHNAVGYFRARVGQH